MSLTNISFPPDLASDLKEAVEYYDFENLNRFFRICGYVIIQHYKRGDVLATPFAFLSFREPEKLYASQTRNEQS